MQLLFLILLRQEKLCLELELNEYFENILKTLEIKQLKSGEE